ncbi:MAG: oxidation-sensing regulator MosR [Candidatus Velthaea sp.]
MFVPPVNCAAFNVQRAARVLTQRYDAALAPAGITSTQYTLLSHISAGVLSVNEIAARVGLDGSTATRNLRLLAESGLIVMEFGSDRRRRVARLSSSGRATLRRALPLWRTVQQQTVKRIGTERFRRLLRELQEL